MVSRQLFFGAFSG